jgi:hypothetical protein
MKKTYRAMLFRKAIAAYSENCPKYTNTICEVNR